MSAVTGAAPEVGIMRACEALSLPRSSYYRAVRPVLKQEEPTNRKHFRALSDDENNCILDVLNCERFMDKAPYEVYATLLDEGIYLCSISTMYRILRKNSQIKERRKQRRHRNYVKPELLAEGKNEVWSWDITKLLGPQKWTYFYLYVIIDIYSRCVVGWMVAHRESAELAKKLIGETCEKHGIEPGQLTIHADRGSSMKSKHVAMLMSDLGITKTHSRPYVSNDNPFSESQFKTMKYRPDFPARFGCLEDARSFCGEFFDWYNWEHYHSGIGLMKPGELHYDNAGAIVETRRKTLSAAYSKNPERFVKKPPTPPELPEAVWINPPQTQFPSELPHSSELPQTQSPSKLPHPAELPQTQSQTTIPEKLQDDDVSKNRQDCNITKNRQDDDVPKNRQDDNPSKTQPALAQNRSRTLIPQNCQDDKTSKNRQNDNTQENRQFYSKPKTMQYDNKSTNRNTDIETAVVKNNY